MSSIISTTHPIVHKPVSDRKLAANRANALKSTGPRTLAGKRVAAQNSLKHGLCTNRAVLPGECEATYNTLHDEIRQDLRPRTHIQNLLVQRIANLYWKLIRLQDAEVHLYDLETLRCDSDPAGDPTDADDANRAAAPQITNNKEQMTTSDKGQMTASDNGQVTVSHDDPDSAEPTLYPCEVLARRFSEDPDNAFVLMHRYEQALQRELRALFSRYAQIQKRWPRTPYNDDEILPQYRRGLSERTQHELTAESTTTDVDDTYESDDVRDSTKRTHGAARSEMA